MRWLAASLSLVVIGIAVGGCMTAEAVDATSSPNSIANGGPSEYRIYVGGARRLEVFTDESEESKKVLLSAVNAARRHNLTVIERKIEDLAAKDYGVAKAPAVALDGKLVFERAPTDLELETKILGRIPQP